MFNTHPRNLSLNQLPEQLPLRGSGFSQFRNKLSVGRALIIILHRHLALDVSFNVVPRARSSKWPYLNVYAFQAGHV